MTKQRQQTGNKGEDIACDFLEKQSYHIMERNYRCRFGEIDIISCINEYLVFCEVKTRSGSGIHPSLAVTPRKMKKLRQLGQVYISSKKLYHFQPRFDVIAIQLLPGKAPVIEHFINAF